MKKQNSKGKIQPFQNQKKYFKPIKVYAGDVDEYEEKELTKKRTFVKKHLVRWDN